LAGRRPAKKIFLKGGIEYRMMNGVWQQRERARRFSRIKTLAAMKRLYALFAFILSGAALLPGQTEPEPLPFPRLALKVAPLAWWDPTMPTFSPSLNYRFHPALAVQAEYGLQFEALRINRARQDLRERRYDKLRAELQYYLPNSRSSNNEMYISVEGFLIRDRFVRINGRLDMPRQSFEVFYGQADGRRYVTGLALKGGVQLALGRRFLADIYGGLGLRRRHVVIANLQDIRLEQFLDREWFGNAVLNRPGIEENLHLSLGCRLGFAVFR
jgi:hypothetical protein